MAIGNPLITRWRALVYIWLLFAGSSSASQEQEPLALYGIGMHTELREPIYIGLLFAPTNVKDLKRLKNPNTPKRMTLKFVSRYSSRQMARMWKQRIALNNDRKLWRPLTPEILTFANLFYQPMQKGDEIELVYKPASGTDVYLNKLFFLNVDKKNFFDSLLNTWIGKIPATQEFKDGISGHNSKKLTQELIGQYDEVSVQIGRFVQKENTLIAPPVQIAQMASTPKKVKNNLRKQIKSKPTTRKTSNKKRKTVSTKKQVPASKSKPKQNSKNRPKNNLKTTSKLNKEKTKLVVERKPVNEKGEVAADPEGNEMTVVSLNAANLEKTAQLELVSNEPVLDVDLMSGSYVKTLVDKIIDLQAYPVRAMVDRAEGNAVAKVIIDKNGDLVESELVQRTRNKFLNRTVLEMIRRATPFPPIPKEFGLEEFEFNVPIKFKLVDRRKRNKKKLKQKK